MEIDWGNVMKPVGDRVWLTTLDDSHLANISEGGIWLPEQVVDDQQRAAGIIVARGDGVGNWELQPGLRVVTRWLSGNAVELGPELRKELGVGPEQPLWYVREDDILAILSQEP